MVSHQENDVQCRAASYKCTDWHPWICGLWTLGEAFIYLAGFVVIELNLEPPHT